MLILSGVAASSLFTSGKYAIDPELRGLEYERITQNLDVHFWKTFWNITESEVLAVSISVYISSRATIWISVCLEQAVSGVCHLFVISHQGLASMTSTQVKVNRCLSVPPDCFDLPLVDNPAHTVTISAPVAHIGPGPVQMRLISSELREGQVTELMRISHTHSYTDMWQV